MSKRLVLVDDSPPMLEQLRRFLEEEAGLQVIATGVNGVEAVELYRRHRPDLITLDITMPEKDGLAALQEILAEFPQARAMMISAIASRQEMLRCIKLGARAYIEKPLLLKHRPFVEEFLESLKSALES